MEFARLKNWHFLNRRNKFSILELDVVYTGKIFPCCVSFLGKLYKIEPNIGDIVILLSCSKGIITPNAAMIQQSNISCGGIHHS